MPMRPISVRMGAAGFSRWVPLNAYTESYGVGLGLVFSDGATLNCTVQHTFDDLFRSEEHNVARVATDLTINWPDHGLSVDDWVQLEDTIWAGEYAVAAITDEDNFTVTVANAGITAAVARIHKARVFPHETLVNISANADGNYMFPCVATRLLVDAYTDGFVDYQLVAGGK